MMNMVLGYKHQHLQESDATDFFVSKITLGKDLMYLDTTIDIRSLNKPWRIRPAS
jgi:hypothetical protein